MRISTVTAGVVLLMAPIAGAIPALAASTPAKPTVRPNPATPGTRVWVYDANQCTAPSGTATSQALAAPIALAPLANMTGGGGTLRTGLAAGAYTITLHCGSTLTTTLHVTKTGARHTATAAGAGTAAGAAGAAGSGRAARATGATAGDGSAEDHLGIGDAAVGGAFLLGGIAFATTSFLRRRRRAANGR